MCLMRRRAGELGFVRRVPPMYDDIPQDDPLFVILNNEAQAM